jgi:CheY-like chemotaxis protein
MPTRVLILENDLTFASELADGLRSLGAEATVVEDPSQGLQLATTEHPSLIVLAVELHKMNGFSVCSRIKKESTLSTVPVVLVTSNSTDVTIDQHRQRPNHADDYVRKPIPVPDLLNRLRKFIALTPSARPSAAPADDEIIIDDEVLVGSARPPSLRPRNSVIPADSDVSTFTDNAFDGIMTEPPASVAPQRAESEPPRRANLALPRAADRRSQPPAAETIPNSSPSAAPPSVTPNSESARVRLRVLEDALEAANSRIHELEACDLSAKEAELEGLRRDLDDARAKLMVSGRGGTSSGSTAREVLDLREQLHRKEKDLLDLRDRLTQREKELLSLKDSSLAIERDKADLSDRLDEIARQLAETQRHAEAARTDREAAGKRADDAKRRIDKLTQQVEEKAQELDQQRALYDTLLAERAAEKARWVEEHQAAEQRAAEDLRAAMARASAEINLQAERAQRELDHVKATADEQNRQHLDRALGEARAAAESQLQRELDELRHELSEEKALALAALERETSSRLNKERAEALEQLQAAHAAERQRTATEHESAIDRVRSELEAASRSAIAERELSEKQRDERIASLQRELETVGQTLAEARSRNTVLEHDLERAISNWAEDRVNIERTKDALAAAFVQLEAIEQRPRGPS